MGGSVAGAAPPTARRSSVWSSSVASTPSLSSPCIFPFLTSILKGKDTYHFESVKPQFCQLFQRFDLPTSHGEIGEYLTPEIARLAENLSGLLFPLLLLCLLSGYRRFSSTPDPHDLSLDEDGVRAESEPPHHVT